MTNVYDLVKEQMYRSPDALAIFDNGESFSYSDLEREVESLSKLILQQAPTDRIICVSTERNASQIIAILAIHHAGKAYLPLDLSLPQARLEQLINESGVKYCISSEFTSIIYEQLSLNPIDKTDVHVLDKLASSPNTDTAYVLFTSGSTGTPKGVSMGHSALANLLQWQKKKSLSGKGTRTLQFAPLSFDVSFQEIYATLIAGSSLYLIDDDTRLDAYQLIQYIIQHKIDRIFLPFVALQYLAEESVAQKIFPVHLREIITAGETLKITPQIKKFIAKIPGLILCNQYGPTECHVVTELRLTGDPEKWPSLPSIGQAIDNTQIYILDEALQLMEDGAIGELCIGGLALAQGYINQATQTEEKFVYWQHPTQGQIRIYRTGDEARYSPDGNIEFMGRKDNQVKIRGYRIELNEIEIAICKIPGIKQAVVTVDSTSAGENKLVAYLIGSNGSLTHTQIRSHLQKDLPDYMIPSAIEWLSAFPKTTSGKVDRKALPSPKNERPSLSVEFKQCTTVMQQKIVDYWKDLLNINEIGIYDNFFDLGGNSLLAQKSISFLSGLFGKRLPITTLYQYPTVEQLSKVIEGNLPQQTHDQLQLSTRSNTKDVAVIGMALRFPGCETLDEYWEMLQHGHEKIQFFNEEDLDPSISPELKGEPNYVKARGIVKDADSFDADFFGLTPVVAQLMDPQQRHFLEISREVLETSGYLPAHFSGTTGVFAGTGNNTYYLNNICSHPSEIAKIGAFQTMTLNEKDYVASRVAFQLNLKGPAVSVHSACSTSLLAIATAVKSIRNGECTLAIAGGASITSPIHSGHLHQEGTMLSKDGHCRPFDAEATGTLFSDGAGAILLKDAEAARKDGDHIYAIIKGTGINNDGQDKGSFTAPSAIGQATVIQMAMQDAGILAKDISYIETHGTATPLGDPIEIEGLKIAFGDQHERQYCRVGSVKGNFGHLTAAAGVAGVIKTVLSLYHGKIPPSINYQTANPHIDFENSPFIVNTALSDWPNISHKIAGVSSFGVGGTNVHIILQGERMTLPSPSTHTGPQLISWSSKNRESQLLYAEKLTHYLKKNPHCSIRDLAYTLQTSREDFSYRNYLVSDSVPNLIEQLKSIRTSEEKVRSENPAVVFLFPGQGSQSINMGRSLYQSEPVFKQSFDRCSDFLAPELGHDLRDLVFCEPSAEAMELLDQTQYTQPAIFAFCYSLAQVWLSWGIKPSAFIGHSLGELVAAHLAGIFTLEDALTIVCKRGKLIAALPKGKMLSVRGDLSKLKNILPTNLSIAAINAPGSIVLSGRNEDIDGFMTQLASEKIPHKLLNTSHAFHSDMLDPITKELETLIASISLSSPATPIVSTVTGRWLSEEEAASPVYWARQARVTVNYSSAIQFIENERKPVYLEIGIGSTCSTFVRQQGSSFIPRCISGIDQDTESVSALASIKTAVGKLWSLGFSVPWQAYYGNLAVQFLSDLPGYAYLKKIHWLDIPKKMEKQTQAIPSTASELPKLFHQSIQSTIMENKIITILKASLEEITGLEFANSDPNSSFIELGLDSLLLTQAALRFKKEFQVPLTYRQLNEELSSLSSLAEYLSVNGQFASTPLPQTAQPSMEQIKEQIALLSQQIDQLATDHRPQQAFHKMSQRPNEADVLQEKPFGAIPRIHTERTSITPQQTLFIKEFIAVYTEKTKNSKSFSQANRKQMADPRVVSGFTPLLKEIIYPIVVNRSEGSKLWDIDGNEYVDALNGFGTNLLGYQPGFIKKILHEQVEKGFELGPQHPTAAEVCNLICEFTGFDRAALCNTGSEAVLGAIRIARTVTGRSLIILFDGSYHGINDEVIVRSGRKSESYPAAPGIPKNAVESVMVLEYGKEESLAIIKERAMDIAAVLVEPVQSRRPEFQPIEFLRNVREITTASDSLLIFDEVITGFRSHGGGAQALFGIQADLATYGKVIGGGLPIGAIAGKRIYMDALDGGHWTYGDTSIPEIGVTYFAGTFVRHPLVLATAKATLEYLKNAGPALQKKLDQKTESLANRLNSVASIHSLPLFVAQFSSLWKIKFSEEYPLQDLLFTFMRNKGIHILPNFPCFLSIAHTEKDVDLIVSAFEESINELLAMDLIPIPKKMVDNEIDSLIHNRPPLPNARIGKDPNGNPAWFIPDPNNKSKFLQIEF